MVGLAAISNLCAGSNEVDVDTKKVAVGVPKLYRGAFRIINCLCQMIEGLSPECNRRTAFPIIEWGIITRPAGTLAEVHPQSINKY